MQFKAQSRGDGSVLRGCTRIDGYAAEGAWGWRLRGDVGYPLLGISSFFSLCFRFSLDGNYHHGIGNDTRCVVWLLRKAHMVDSRYWRLIIRGQALSSGTSGPPSYAFFFFYSARVIPYRLCHWDSSTYCDCLIGAVFTGSLLIVGECTPIYRQAFYLSTTMYFRCIHSSYHHP